MDLSKLPKLSDTKSQTQAQPDASPLNVVGYQPPDYRPAGIGGDIWISLIMGVIFIYLGSSFLRYCTATISRQQYHSGFTWDSDGPRGAAGQEIAYWDLPGFTALSDMGIFLFGLTLLFEALSKTLSAIKPSTVSRFAMKLAMALTVIAVMLNMIACAKLLSVQITPLMSGLAVALGGWILIDQWTSLRRLRQNAKTY